MDQNGNTNKSEQTESYDHKSVHHWTDPRECLVTDIGKNDTDRPIYNGMTMEWVVILGHSRPRMTLQTMKRDDLNREFSDIRPWWRMYPWDTSCYNQWRDPIYCFSFKLRVGHYTIWQQPPLCLTRANRKNCVEKVATGIYNLVFRKTSTELWWS